MFLATGIGCVLAQIPVAAILIGVKLAGGSTIDEAVKVFGKPWGFIAVALPAQLAILAAWWLASSKGDPRGRALRPIGATRLPWAAYPCFAWATLVVLWLGALLAEAWSYLLGSPESSQFADLYRSISWPSGIALVLFIALAPGFCEELFFRGYMQRRLLARLSPGLAIPIVALIFAGFHGTPVWALSVLPLGVWFGILAWRTGSLWPGIVCHAFINGSVNLVRVLAALEVLPAEFSATTYGLILGSAGACLLLSIWLLVRHRASRCDRSRADSYAGLMAVGSPMNSGSSPHKSAIDSTTMSGR